MSISKVKILMSRGSKEQYPSLKNKINDRYSLRQHAAEGAGLNFRLKGVPIGTHGIRKYLESCHYRTGAHGLCAVCGREAQVCTCKIIVSDASGAVLREI